MSSSRTSQRQAQRTVQPVVGFLMVLSIDLSIFYGEQKLMPVAMMLLSLAGRQACVAGRRGGVWKTAATSTASLPRGQQRNGPSSCATPASQARAIESAAIRPPAPPPMPLAEGTQSGGTRRAARQSDLIANRRRPHHAATGWTGNGASVPSSRARATPGACEGVV